jgi:two-component system nitrogen regulation response regulator NtrX
MFAALPFPIVADSEAMRRVLAEASRAAASPGGVLLRGEPGSGRRLLARVIHDLRADPDALFIEADCTASAGTDAEIRLFGIHETAPRSPRRRGVEQVTRDSLVCRAFGGTLVFLNLPQLPGRAQDRLVRVLRDREAAIVGGGRLRGGIRAIACVEPAFDALGDDERLRVELGKRLSATCIDVPPLRERRPDIVPLAQMFLKDACLIAGVAIKELSDPARALLETLPFSGNVRELRHLVALLVSHTHDKTVHLDDVVHAVRGNGALTPIQVATLRDARLRFEEQYIREVLEQYRGRVADAAHALGIQRTNLYRKMRLLGVTYASRRTSS